jgi:hypothetical protein
MPAYIGDKIRLGIIMEVAGNHNGLFPISRDANSCRNQGVLSGKWEEPVVDGLRKWLPTRGVRGARLRLNPMRVQNKYPPQSFLSHANECERHPPATKMAKAARP